MNVELITIPKEAARAKLRAYRKALAQREHTAADRRVTDEWRAILSGYKAAARGLQLIELSKAMAIGGWDEQGRPRFAVARADRKRVECTVFPGFIRFRDLVSHHAPSMHFQWPLAGFPARPAGTHEYWSGRAIVPMVPPDVLPRVDLDLSRRAILWEADWLAPPVDPLLLLPLGGDLYAVEAAWDLSPLERAVITGRGQ